MASIWQDKQGTYYLDTGEGVLAARSFEIVDGVPVMVNPHPLENLPSTPLYPARQADLINQATS